MSITREYISVSGFRIYWYGIIIALGVAAAVITALRREAKFGLKKDTVLDTVLVCVPAGIIGARLYYVLMKPGDFPTLASVIYLRSGGLAIYGGLIAGALAAMILARIKHISVIALADTAAPSIALAQAIGRWGNFMNQEAYGIAIADSRLQFFPLAVYIDSQSGWFCATFFYESLWCLVTALVIFRLRKPAKGACALSYLIMYAAERCFVEGLRTDSLYMGSMRISQVLSAVILISACVFAVIRSDKKKHLILLLPAALAVCTGVMIKNLPIIGISAAAMCVLGMHSTKSLPDT